MRKEEIFHLFARQHYLWDCDWGHTLRDCTCMLLIDLLLLIQYYFQEFQEVQKLSRTKKDRTKRKDLETTVGSGFGTWKPWHQHRLTQLATLQCAVILSHLQYSFCYVHIDHNLCPIVFVLISVRKSSSTHLWLRLDTVYGLQALKCFLNYL